MAEDTPAVDTSESAVQKRVDQVCNDLVGGHTTPKQRSGLTGAVERAGRVSSGSDEAVKRIARMAEINKQLEDLRYERSGVAWGTIRHNQLRRQIAELLAERDRL